MKRQESSVDLGPIMLEGKPGATNRRVALDVTVDGADASALGVMSQGELHALALALFLPRAMMPESPFRFLVIDDPVQSMDPAKVDGLARMLSETAKTRQVIVFTHDARLPAAIRRLDLPAMVWEVTRRENSVVELRSGSIPRVARSTTRAHHVRTRRAYRAGYRIKAFKHSLAKAIRAAELPEGFRPHDLRHRRVTTWLAEGRDVVLVKEAVGHSALQTTMGYTHLAREHVRALVDEADVRTSVSKKKA